MSRACEQYVWHESETTGNDRLVLLAIADEADDDGHNAYPSMERIAHKARLNKHTVMRAVARLEEAGELVVTRPERYGRGRFNRYVVVMGRDVDEAQRVADEKGDTLAPFSEPGMVAPGRAVSDSKRARKGAKGRAQEQPDLLTNRDVSVVARSEEQSRASADEFERFWAIYPRKTAKGTARARWKSAVAKAGSVEKILAGAQRYARDPNRDPRYTAHAATWLNGERWEDEPLPSVTGSNGARPPDPLANDPRRAMPTERVFDL